jgi:hypothetical protein
LQEIRAVLKDIVVVAAAKAASFEVRPAGLHVVQGKDSGSNGKEVLDRRVQEFLLQMTTQVEGIIRTSKALEWQLEIKERRARALATALDMSLLAQRLAEERWQSIQQRRGAESTREQGQAWTRVALLEQRVALLTTQIDAANRRTIELGAVASRAQQERDTVLQAFEGLQRRQDLSGADHAAELTSLEERCEERFTQRSRELNGELREFVREEALRVLNKSDPDDQIIILTMDLCAHKAEQKALLDRMGIMQDNIDCLRRQTAAQRETLLRDEQRLAALQKQLADTRRGNVSHEGGPVSLLQIQEPREDAESILFAIRSDLQYERAQGERLRDELAEAIAARDDSERREREGAVALKEFQSSTTQELAAQRQTLICEMQRAEEDLKVQYNTRLSRHQEQLSQVEKEFARAQMELADLLEQRRDRPDVGVNTDADELQSMEREEVEGRLSRMQEELVHLSAQVRALDGELVATREELEKRDDVIRSLESAITAAATKEGARAGGGASSLSKQLVAAKVAEAECQRRLRRAQQTETDLRQVTPPCNARF